MGKSSSPSSPHSPQKKTFCQSDYEKNARDARAQHLYFQRTRKVPHGCLRTTIACHTKKSPTWNPTHSVSQTHTPWVGLISLFSGIGKDAEAVIVNTELHVNYVVFIEQDPRRRAMITKFCKVYFIDHDFPPDVTTMDIRLVFHKVKEKYSKTQQVHTNSIGSTPQPLVLIWTSAPMCQDFVNSDYKTPPNRFLGTRSLSTLDIIIKLYDWCELAKNDTPLSERMKMIIAIEQAPLQEPEFQLLQTTCNLFCAIGHSKGRHCSGKRSWMTNYPIPKHYSGWMKPLSDSISEGMTRDSTHQLCRPTQTWRGPDGTLGRSMPNYDASQLLMASSEIVNRHIRTTMDPNKSILDIPQCRNSSWSFPTREQTQWRSHLEKYAQEYAEIIQLPTGEVRDLALGSFIGRTWLTLPERPKLQILTDRASETIRINATGGTWDLLVAGPVILAGVAHWRLGNLQTLPIVLTPAQSFFAIWDYSKNINKEHIFLDRGFQLSTFHQWLLITSWKLRTNCGICIGPFNLQIEFPMMNTSTTRTCGKTLDYNITWHPEPPRSIVPHWSSS